MPKEVTFPYPPSPDDVPDGYTDFPHEYRSKQWTLVACMLAFLGLYLWFVLAALGMAVIFLLAIPRISILGIVGAGFCLVMFVFLVKGLFHRDQPDKELHLEVTEADQPKLFGFIRQLCDEVGVDEPHKVFVSPEVNAAVITRTSLANVFVRPKRDLLIGLGLVNALNLSEFKAAMAHEFGHFAQGGFLNSYFYAVYRIAYGIVVGRDWLDEAVDGMRKSGNGIGIALGFVIWAPMALLRWVMDKVFKGLAFQRHSVLKEREFHADRVAAALAGSNAITHTLYRLGFASETFGMALTDLKKAADHKLYSADLYYHQHAAGDILRRKKRDPEYGRPPKLETPTQGKKIQVFDPDKDEDPEEDGDYHPPNHEREEHVKAKFVPADEDERSAWILFSEPVDLRERLTYKMYRRGLGIKKNTELDDPKKVQKFIDDEHHETTYDDKYEGAYDDRLLNPGDLDELDDLIRKEPWEDARLSTVHDKLFHGLKDKVEERRELLSELAAVRKEAGGAMSKKTKKIIKNLEKDLDDANDWFRTLDRRVYLVYVQMSYRVNNDLYYDLINRYRFHMAVQGIYKTARYHFDEAEFHLATYSALSAQNAPPEVKNDFVTQVLHVLREARTALRKLLREAREINMPAMKNFEEGEELADFLLDEDLIREAGEHGVSGKWIDKLFRQLTQVRDKASRLHFKSLGQILSLQEGVAEQFLVLKGFKQAAPLPQPTLGPEGG